MGRRHGDKGKAAKSKPIRNRIKELRYIKASELAKNPRNWRTHGKKQADALEGVLREVGIATALVAYESPEHGLTLIDGHLRRETLERASPDEKIPVIILDVDDEEAAKLLATFDPLGAMAETDTQALDELLQDVQFDDEAVEAMLDGLADAEEEMEAESKDKDDHEADVTDPTFQILILCRDESHQVELLERFETEGLNVRALLG